MDIPPITSSHNRQLSMVRRYLARPRDCRQEGILIADGIHLVQEAFRASLPCRSLFVAHPNHDPEIEALLDQAKAKRPTIYPVRPDLFRAISPVETPQGILGLFERPRHDRAQVWRVAREGPGVGHLVVCDGIQDPTNLGSIARSAVASGIRAMFTTPGTVDAYHPRALRASMGASFFLPLLTEESALPLASALRDLGFRTVALTPRGAEDLRSLDPGSPAALFLGGEGSGLDPVVSQALDVRIKIPTRPEVESLGVAASAAVVFFWLLLTAPPSLDPEMVSKE